MSMSKPRNGKMSSQDYMNLIYSDTDSDTVPDLKLPPLKGKKPKRKSAPRPAVSVKKGCSWCSVVKVGINILLVAAVVALSIAVYWLMQHVKEQEDRIGALETKNAHNPEGFQDLQSKLTLMNKSLNDMKSGKYGLDNLNKSIAKMQSQIASLSATQTELRKNIQVQDSSDSSHKDVRNAVADLGSSLVSTQSDVSSLKSSQRILTTQVTNMTSRVVSFETRIESLDNITQTLQDKMERLDQLAVSLNQSQKNVQKYVTHQLQSCCSNSTTGAVSVTAPSDVHVQDNFRTEVFQDITSLNASVVLMNNTVGILRHDVEDLFAKMTAVQTNISTITTTLQDMSYIVHREDTATGKMEAGTVSPKAGDSVDTGSDTPSNTPLSSSDLSTHNNKDAGSSG